MMFLKQKNGFIVLFLTEEWISYVFQSGILLTHKASHPPCSILSSTTYYTHLHSHPPIHSCVLSLVINLSVLSPACTFTKVHLLTNSLIWSPTHPPGLSPIHLSPNPPIWPLIYSPHPYGLSPTHLSSQPATWPLIHQSTSHLPISGLFLRKLTRD